MSSPVVRRVGGVRRVRAADDGTPISGSSDDDRIARDIFGVEYPNGGRDA